MVWGATMIDKPAPYRDSLEWDSSSDDFIPTQQRADVDILWWSIHIEKGATQELYDEMFEWCEENMKYQCGLRYEDMSKHYSTGDDYIMGFFRHPDDAFAFKLRWV